MYSQMNLESSSNSLLKVGKMGHSEVVTHLFGERYASSEQRMLLVVAKNSISILRRMYNYILKHKIMKSLKTNNNTPFWQRNNIVLIGML